VEGATTVDLEYTAVPPIASCQWQWVANVFSHRGRPGLWRQLGLSWGYSWRGGSVLFGSLRWPALVAEATGAVVEIETFSTLEAALGQEQEHYARGFDVIVEVDEFFLPGYPVAGQHVLHAVLVVGRSADAVSIVDTNSSSAVLTYDLEAYAEMRAHPCEGRIERFKLYVVKSAPERTPPPTKLLRLVRRDLATSYDVGCQALDRYLTYMASNDDPVDVCRVAGERYQATRLFEYLSEAGVPGTARLPDLFEELTEQWYLVHLLASSERSRDPRRRRRTLAILGDLALKDAEATRTVLANVPSDR
jgi:hypothetical protein